MIEQVGFEAIYPLWRNHLWPNRTSPIESHSAMLLYNTFDLKNFTYDADYFLYKVNGKTAGCNSGHMCCDGTYRSRGLFVFPEYRKQGIGTLLLLHTIDKAKTKQASIVWSYPKFESWSTYKSAGFKLVSDWTLGETGKNAFCTT